MLSTFFPLLLCLVFSRLDPIRVQDYYPSRQDWERARDAAAPRRVPQHFIWRQLLVTAVATVLAALLQAGLFRMDHASDTMLLFSYRASDNIAYSLLVGFFLGLVIASVVLSHLVLRRGRAYVKQLLLQTWNGSYVYTNLRVFRPVTLAIGVALTLLNMATANTFLEIGRSDIRHSGLMSIEVAVEPVDNVSCINRYSRRIAPIGIERLNPTLEIVFGDGSTLDTFYLIETYHFNAVVEALRTAYGDSLRVFQRDQATSNGRSGSCD